MAAPRPQFPPPAPPPPAPPSAGMSKRRRVALRETRTTLVDSGAVEFKVDYERTKNLDVGVAVQSDAFSVGGHMWMINWFPRGFDASVRGVTMMVGHMSKSRSVKVIIEASLLNKNDRPDLINLITSKGSFLGVFGGFENLAWLPCFLEHKDVLNYVIDGQIRVFCSIRVLSDSPVAPIPVPPSDIGKHLGVLLDSTDGADVSFIVDGETFHAHRAVLAARSPVFRAQLLGSMAESTMSSITLHDIAPATFSVMLRFMYTDALPEDSELGDSPAELFKHLLAAADMYALDRLKIICAQKLLDNVSVNTVGDALGCAEIYNCPELKNKCIDFIAPDKNFALSVLSESFVQLMKKFPPIIDEVRERIRK